MIGWQNEDGFGAQTQRRVTAAARSISDDFTQKPKVQLSYFDEILAVELHAINARRKKIAEQERADPYRLKSDSDVAAGQPVQKLKPHSRRASVPAPPASSALPQPVAEHTGSVNAEDPDESRMRPLPIPCTAVGLALSGGGIRAAAFSLGALQALDYHKVISRTDYLSTVSGGGYIGACMTAAMSSDEGRFPFGGASDIRDNDVIGHLRNYSNYLMPRARRALSNVLDVLSIVLRGLLANALVVSTFLLLAAFITFLAFPTWEELPKGNFIPHLLYGWANGLWVHLMAPAFNFVVRWLDIGTVASGTLAEALAATPLQELKSLIPSGLVAVLVEWGLGPFRYTLLTALAVAVVLILWALQRSSGENGSDVDSRPLMVARWLLGFTLLSLFLDVQPLFIHELLPAVYDPQRSVPIFLIALIALVGANIIAFSAGRLGAFLGATELTPSNLVRVLRLAAQASVIIGGLVLPIILFVVYWHLSAWLIGAPKPIPEVCSLETCQATMRTVLIIFVVIMLLFNANAYSLHQFYKDRLSKAFLFNPLVSDNSEPKPLKDYKLSDIKTADCPYHIINAALNVQGSKEANRRGRNADFFMFTPDFVGSDLTHFASTKSGTTIEIIDRNLDLGTAMAISGAALSANMGSQTVRWLSPTLALLNVRLGYWLRNPRDLAKSKTFYRPREIWSRIIGKAYLLLEMFNALDEERSFVYLSDGGHVENLGVYQLLKRGCRLIIVIDAEADPEISCASLLQLERYARIDLGVRIILPWEQIAEGNATTNEGIDPATPGKAPRLHGSHCAIGPILYEDGSRGIMLYFKSSLSGDEKDYVLDYKKRYRDFPHETTSDQFFTEEQFEVYRTLGYHIVDGFFSGGDEVSWIDKGLGKWPNLAAARNEVMQALRLS